jgi:APA family basic amino acid/polyamine antiporter
MENLAVIVFREADEASYQPEFETPGYPYIQILGFLAGAVLITQMGTLPILGAVGIIAGGLIVYLVYGRSRTDRTGAIDTLLDRWGDDRKPGQPADTD